MREYLTKLTLIAIFFACIVLLATFSCMWTPWRNGSASDSRSEGCVFESRRGQLTFFAIILIIISIEKNVKVVLKGVEIIKQLVKINEICCCVESICLSPLYTLAVLINIDEVKGAGYGRGEG